MRVVPAAEFAVLGRTRIGSERASSDEASGGVMQEAKGVDIAPPTHLNLLPRKERPV